MSLLASASKLISARDYTSAAVRAHRERPGPYVVWRFLATHLACQPPWGFIRCYRLGLLAPAHGVDIRRWKCMRYMEVQMRRY